MAEVLLVHGVVCAIFFGRGRSSVEGGELGVGPEVTDADPGSGRKFRRGLDSFR